MSKVSGHFRIVGGKQVWVQPYEQKLHSVRQTGRTFGVFRRGKLVDGGFFSRKAADSACERWNRLGY